MGPGRSAAWHAATQTLADGAWAPIAHPVEHEGCPHSPTRPVQQWPWARHWSTHASSADESMLKPPKAHQCKTKQRFHGLVITALRSPTATAVVAARCRLARVLVGVCCYVLPRVPPARGGPPAARRRRPLARAPPLRRRVQQLTARTEARRDDGLLLRDGANRLACGPGSDCYGRCARYRRLLFKLAGRGGRQGAGR